MPFSIGMSVAITVWRCVRAVLKNSPARPHAPICSNCSPNTSSSASATMRCSCSRSSVPSGLLHHSARFMAGNFRPGPLNSPAPMIDVTPLRAFADNYIWLLRSPKRPATAVVVDPGDAQPVLEALEAEQLQLGAVLLTHHHADHIGGAKELRA